MKTERNFAALFWFVLGLFLMSALISCSKTIYVPVETTKTEYRDKIVRDSIFRYDSVFVRQQSDTVFFERYRYLYKNKIVRDSIFQSDTIKVPYPVEVEKKVNYITGFQNFQIWLGRILVVILLLWLFFRLRK